MGSLALSTLSRSRSLDAYRASLASFHPLGREEEQDLARRFKSGDKRAGERIVEACLPFVISVALEYRRWGVPLEDVIQQGNLGLLRAVAKFDPDRECRLATYAVYWIRAEIREYVVRGYRVVRLGTTKAERRALRAYRTTKESDPKILASVSGLSEERVEMLLPLLAARETSLDASKGDMPPAIDRVPAPEPSPEDLADLSERESITQRAVRDAMLSLSDREKLIVRERLMRDEPLTLQRLGEVLGISKERVRQIEERAFSKLRDRLGALAPVA